MDYKTLLNKEQYEAAMVTDGPVLVSAGAGSGKTRLLTYRIAYLITEKNVPPHKILAITFTNKAAGEMKERISRVAPDGDMVTVCTFHSFCARMLRAYASFIPGYKENFTIFSEDDTKKILKEIFKQLNIDDESTKCNYKHNLSVIKNDNMTIEEFANIYSYDKDISTFVKFYHMYQDELKKNNAMDFDDLLINFYQLIKTNPSVLESIQNKYTYFSVDEFQDTNKLQYDIIKLLSGKTKNILIVGDEDQSIYGWRGANINNIFNFTKDFPEVKIFKLEQNYRSTKKILERANMIIQNNKSRLDKKLFTDNDDGTDIVYYQAQQEGDEADFVVRNIITQHNYGVPYKEMAVLMRVNSLSLEFEKKMMAYNIPYVMYNGFKFFERQEIKNVLAYLTAMVNPDDNISFARIINFPKRGIGDTSIEKLNQIARKNQTNLKQVVLNYEDEILPKALRDKLKNFKETLLDLDKKMTELTMSEFFTYMLETVGILEAFDMTDEKEKERRLNIDSLTKDIFEFEKLNPDATILNYLENVTLSTNMDNDNGSGVVIATVHGAKGLEFNTVFVVGCEEKIFPISRDDADDLEEERRLMYVAITRAKKDLFLTSASSRFMYGKRDYMVKSRFLRELDLVPDRQIKSFNQTYKNYGGNMNTLQSNNNKSFNYTFSKETVSKKAVDYSKIKLGAKVSHPKFGDGTITEITPNSSNHCVKIKFDVVGEKMLSLEYAPIEFKD